jgi:hypothetical protein
MVIELRRAGRLGASSAVRSGSRAGVREASAERS